MSAILENQHPTTLLPTRFTEVKRVNNNSEVKGFFKSCVKRLRSTPQWNYMSPLNFAYQISAHDATGLVLNREISKGDYIKIVTDYDGTGKRFFWLSVDDVQYEEEADLSEESIRVTLREIENPSLIQELSLVNSLKSKCELQLRRLINTISMDVQVVNQHTIDQSKNFLNYFKWEMFAKQILLQL